MKTAGVVLSVLFVIGGWLPASAPAQTSVGSVTTVKNRVGVTHLGQGASVSAKVGDRVLFKDTFETEAEARAKLLFEDDSLLTLGEKTRLQITENVYDPARHHRSSTVEILSGRLRVLVGRVFSGTGSKFEVHTPTAVAASRGTYYIVWIFMLDGKPATGIAVLEGAVEAQNIDSDISGTVQLGPNQYTIVTDTAPPKDAEPIDPDLLAELLLSTDLPDELKDLFPPDLLQSSGPGSSNAAGDFTENEDGIPGLPPILQQPAVTTTPVQLEIGFP